ncbi:MAG: hypothetical protein ACYS8S_05570, partial [Planctomycetota bacterium]
MTALVKGTVESERLAAGWGVCLAAGYGNDRHAIAVNAVDRVVGRCEITACQIARLHPKCLLNSGIIQIAG